MATCGYTCPQCEGKGFLEDGTVCDWCGEEVESSDKKLGIGNDEWGSESTKRVE